MDYKKNYKFDFVKLLMNTVTLPTYNGVALAKYASLYKDELLGNILPFWLKHSRDEVNGGYFTCLNRDGSVYDTDKFIWLQGRQVWCFSFMYNEVDPREEWLDMALHGAGFMQRKGQDEQGNWYFSLTADGQPLVQPYNIFSDCFAAMAFAALDKAMPSDLHRELALKTFNNILARKDNPKGKYNKSIAGTRPLRSFSLPMILCNLSLEMEHILGAEKVNELAARAAHEVLNDFYKPSFGLVLENVNPDGSFCDSFEGRLLNPGHAIEAMWFIMDIGKRTGDQSLIQKACEIMLATLAHGWDKEYGGIYYFMDVKGHPVQQLEWDQKLWWVHAEALVALAKGYKLTGDEHCRVWFEKVHEYVWDKFRDPDYGEWFGYLNRRGEVLLPLKGGKWKGCFHIPRALYQVWKTLEIV